MMIVVAALLGLVFGSALTALLSRQASGQSWLRGRSQCPRCRHALAPRDLIPVVSYVLLRGRCRYCSGPIGASYPLIEITTGLLFALVVATRLAQAHEPSQLDWHRFFLVARDLTAVVILFQIFLFDLWYGYILDQITLPAIVLFFVWNILLDVRPTSLILGMAVGGGFFLLQYLLSSGRWVGGGDIRLGVLMGALLGWPLISLGLFFSYVVGGAVGVFLLASKKKSWGSHIPFGTFLSAATLVVLLWGYNMVRWYVTRML